MCAIWEPVTPAIDDTLMIPPPVRFIASAACLVPRKAPREFTAIKVSRCCIQHIGHRAAAQFGTPREPRTLGFARIVGTCLAILY